MRIAATADLHFSAQSYSTIQDQFVKVRDEADLLLIAGDLTNYGQPPEMEMLLNALVRLRLPTVAVLGNHDYESGQESELQRMMAAAGIKVLDGTGYERDVGEREVKAFVQAAIDEAVKLERAMSQLRTKKRIVVLHYSPIASTVMGEAPEIFPFLGTSRLAEVVDRHGADLVVHGHAHRGTLEGKTTGGIPVHNVAITLLQQQNPSAVYRIFDM